MKSELEFDKMHFSVLQEIGSIGAGNAATALSTLIGRKVDMKIPKIQFLDFQQTGEALGGAEIPVAAVLITVNSENVNGIMMFIVEMEKTAKLVSSIMGVQPENISELGKMERSALREIGSILTANYIGVLATLLGIEIDRSVPSLAIDMSGAILSLPATEFAKVADKTLFIESVFYSDEDDVSGYFIFVPDQNSFKFIFEKLGLDI